MNPLPTHLTRIVTALIVALAGTLGLFRVSLPSAAAAAPVDACRAADPNLHTGYCHRFPDGRITWLGSFTNPAGRVFFCIDKNLDSRLPLTAPTVSTAGLTNQFGVRIGRAEVAALNYVITTWGRRAGTVDSAAIALIIRQVMSDTRGQFPAGLRVGSQVQDLAGNLPAPILRRARTLWRTAALNRGPWRILVTGSRKDLKVGDERRFEVAVLSAANRRIRARVNLSVTHGTAPRHVDTPEGGSAPFTLTSTRSGMLELIGTATGPAQDGRLFDPVDSGVQRGWIAGSSTARARLALRARIEKSTPRVTTETSRRETLGTQGFHDTITVTGLPRGTRLWGTATLYGPFTRPPTSTSCTPRKRSATLRFAVNGSGTYTTRTVKRDHLGYWTWVAALPASPNSAAARHRCGLAKETTRVVPPRLDVRVSTAVSSQQALVGDQLRDTVIVSGIGSAALSAPVTIRWSLLGPVAPNNGSCTDLIWDGAATADSGALQVRTDGRYSTPQHVVQVAGCYTYAETVVPSREVVGHVHPPGEPTQTSIVQHQPLVATQVSAQRVAVDSRVRDTITVSGLGADVSVSVVWTLYGPVAPVGQSCTGLEWSAAPVFDSGTITVTGNRTVTTRPSRAIARHGCYSYAEAIPATDLARAAVHPVGQPSQTTVAFRRTPRVRTLVNTQVARVGARLKDSMAVSGLPRGTTVRVTWTLNGPVAARNGSCVAVSWQGAPVLDRGSLNVTGNGTVSTRASRPVPRSGCYSYAEVLPETRTTEPTEHPVGLPSQTTVVTRWTPSVQTRVSQQRGQVGIRLRDAVKIHGLAPGTRAAVDWWLRGPVRPVRGSCRTVAWRGTPVFDHGTLRASNGTTRTRPSQVVRRPGCYTYTEHLLGTDRTDSVWHSPGLPSQTALVTSHGTPEISTGTRGADPLASRTVRASAGRLSIASLGIRDVAIRAVGDAGGVVQLPPPALVGWWTGSVPFASTQGSSIVAGHVSDRHDVPGAFHRLAWARRGALVRWTRGGTTRVFRVVRTRFTPRSGALPSSIWRWDGPRVLTLVSCAHKVTYPDGRFHYTHIVTVTAQLIRVQRL